MTTHLRLLLCDLLVDFDFLPQRFFFFFLSRPDDEAEDDEDDEAEDPVGEVDDALEVLGERRDRFREGGERDRDRDRDRDLD